MKSVFKIFFLVAIALLIMHVRADARGEIPPPPPFQGGNAGDWLGSGPIFGFEEPSLGNPWKGGGSNSDPYGGASGGGGSNGGWGGAWWNGNGPLGGGGWGGWGGWGSGLGAGSGGLGIDTDTSKKGYIWPEEQDSPFTTCFVETLQGGYSKCACWVRNDAIFQPDGRRYGTCGSHSKAYGLGRCDYVGQKCYSYQ